MIFDFSPEKNAWLQENRNVSFTEVIEILETRGALHEEPHPDIERYPNQRVFYIELHDYIYRVPYVTDGAVCFLKTIYPSRFDKKRFLSH